MESQDEPGWFRQIRDIATQSHALLRDRWEKVQESDTKVLPLAKLPNLSFDQDSELKLQNLRRHLSWIKSRSTSHRHPMGLGDTTHFTSLQHSEPPALSSSEAPKDASMELTQLLDFETWVESTLSGWSKSKMDLKAIKINLEVFRRTRAFLTASLSWYLVIMELRLALDKIAGHAIPLLLDYDPGFSLDAFCPLLLERKQEMARLRNLESYLSRRRERAPTPYPSAFEGF
ncbi:hypothetical protein BR93DRAFT_967607 [Coniochaeta sp. PMI_546]|nr:hypothetical protein BR93DRAFT_967607 [Coniochaeta sp. PMI_546]